MLQCMHNVLTAHSVHIAATVHHQRNRPPPLDGSSTHSCKTGSHPLVSCIHAWTMPHAQCKCEMALAIYTHLQQFLLSMQSMLIMHFKEGCNWWAQGTIAAQYHPRYLRTHGRGVITPITTRCCCTTSPLMMSCLLGSLRCTTHASLELITLSSVRNCGSGSRSRSSSRRVPAWLAYTASGHSLTGAQAWRVPRHAGSRPCYHSAVDSGLVGAAAQPQLVFNSCCVCSPSTQTSTSTSCPWRVLVGWAQPGKQQLWHTDSPG